MTGGDEARNCHMLWPVCANPLNLMSGSGMIMTWVEQTACHTEPDTEGTTMLEFIRNITSRRNQDGASAVEYGLLVAGIAALVVVIVFAFGGVIKSAFQGTCKQIKPGWGAPATC